jgi:glycosyltransferase domain-containing protein
MNHANDLTILLAVKDRVPFTQRWLAYAASVQLPYKIMIADGGSDAATEQVASGGRALGLDVEYVRYPFDATYADYYAKLADALSRVPTPFAVMADNDDMFIPEGLARAVRFLTANPSYVACGGQCAVFWVSSGDGGVGDTVYGDSLEWKCTSHLHSDVAETARQRLIDHALNSSDAFYSVHRTAVLRRAFEVVRECNPRDLFLMEQTVAFHTAIAGKCRQLDHLYIARQQDSPGSSGGTHQERFGGWFERMLQPTWSDDITRVVDAASQALACADASPIDTARRVILDAYKMSVAPSLLRDVLTEPTVSLSMPMVLQVVGRLVTLPRTSLTRRYAQWLYRTTRWVSHDLVHGTQLRTRRSSAASGEFAPVRSFLEASQRHNS